MKIERLLENPVVRRAPKAAEWIVARLQRIPAARRRIDAAFDEMLAPLRRELRPYDGEIPTHRTLPDAGRPEDEVLSHLDRMAEREKDRWFGGRVSGAVYHGGEAHAAFMSEVYRRFGQTNPLHPDVWPSLSKFEAEIVAMTADMLGAEAARAADPAADVCGTVTSGGTESILLAMKAYRDRARARGLRRVEIVVPETAHAAFDKAGAYFGIRVVKVPVGPDFRADPAAMARAITPRTVAMVGSAPSFPHGVIDPIEELSEIARANGIGFHTDACLGGFVLAFADAAGIDVPPFDFRLPGVTSMSIDTHKYGYAPKGTSVVLYRDRDLRHHQYFVATDWPGGLYFSPTLAGSRPGAPIAQCWATMLHMGREGYRDAARRILETGRRIREGIEAMDGLRVLGDPLWVIAFTSDEVDIYRVLERMTRRGWSLNGLHRPPCVHIAVTLRHVEPGVADAFLADLSACVEEVRREPPGDESLAPIYGMAATVPTRGLVAEILRRYVDLLYEP